MYVLNIAFGNAQAHVLAALCELGIADALSKGPRTAAELGEQLGETCLELRL